MVAVSQVSGCPTFYIWLTFPEGPSFLISNLKWAYLLETKAEASLDKLAWKSLNAQKLVLGS